MAVKRGDWKSADGVRYVYGVAAEGALASLRQRLREDDPGHEHRFRISGGPVGGYMVQVFVERRARG